MLSYTVFIISYLPTIYNSRGRSVTKSVDFRNKKIGEFVAPCNVYYTFVEMLALCGFCANIIADMGISFTKRSCAVITYELFTESKYDRRWGFYSTYGIVAVDGGQIRRIVKDISVDRDKVEALAAAFNREGLELTHLSQAVEDFLYDFEV